MNNALYQQDELQKLMDQLDDSPDFTAIFYCIGGDRKYRIIRRNIPNSKKQYALHELNAFGQAGSGYYADHRESIFEMLARWVNQRESSPFYARFYGNKKREWTIAKYLDPSVTLDPAMKSLPVEDKIY